MAEEDTHPIVEPWIVEKTEAGPDLILFHTRYDWVRSPHSRKGLRAIVLESPDWVNVVALTPENKILVVRQYRFGTRSASSEIPAGLIEPGETPAHAAARELAEETGYTSDDWTPTGWIEANPAFLNNRCYLWLAKNAVKTLPTHMDETEEVYLDIMTEDQVRAEIAAGRMRNTYSLMGLSRVIDLRYTSLPY